MRRAAFAASLALAIVAAWFVVALGLPYQGFPREGIFVQIPRGTSRRAIARLLADQGVVRSRIAFEALCRWRSRRTLQAGEYFFEGPKSALEVFRLLAEGRVYVKAVTVPEGYAVFDIAALLEREGLARREAFLEATRDVSLVHDLAPDAQSLEGFLFPATYQFPRHVGPQEIASAMVRRFREAWQSLPEDLRRREGVSVEGVVTLASLIERETAVPEERPLVAGVFSNRLRRGIALQCDPTVIYALQLAGRYAGSLDSGDLAFDSPYNTYRHTGLPPGPIGNPGMATLRTALNPPVVDYLYFVADARGRHLFSKTLEEHNRNVALYRRRLAQVTGEQSADTPQDKSDARRP